MSYTCHIHTCAKAADRHLATRIATEVGRARTADAEDFVDELVFRLSDLGLEDARVRTRGTRKDVVLEGRFIMTWLPAEEVITEDPRALENNHALSLKAAARAYPMAVPTLQRYQRIGLLPAELSVRVMDAFMAAQRATRTAPAAPVTITLRSRTFLERLRLRERRGKRKSRSCMTAWRGGFAMTSGQGPRTPHPAITDCFAPERARSDRGWVLRAAPVPTLRELIPLPLRRDAVLSRDSATIPLVRTNGPPVLALAHAPP